MTLRPVRFKESTGADGFVRDLFAAGRPTAMLPPASRLRGERRVGKLATIPVVVLGVGLWAKVVAAAFGVGFASALALVAVSPTLKERLGPAAPRPPHEDVARPAPPMAPPATQVVAEPAASVVPPAEPAATATVPASRPARSTPVLPRGPVAAPTSQSLSLGSLENPVSAVPAVAEKPLIEDSMPAEVRMLSHARLLVSSDPTGALELLEQHAAMFPKAALETEREVLVVEALERAGRVKEAKARAQRLLSGERAGFYATRLGRMLAPPATQR